MINAASTLLKWYVLQNRMSDAAEFARKIKPALEELDSQPLPVPTQKLQDEKQRIRQLLDLCRQYEKSEKP
jgi:t-SNARE complex subunit (syntaxin)